MSRNRNAYEAFILITPKVLPEYLRPLKEFSRAFGKTIVISMEEEHLDKLPKSLEIYKGVNSHGNPYS